jgi:hypothetical protein
MEIKTTAANTMFLLWCVDVLPKVYIFVQRLVSGTGRGFGSAPQQKHTRCAPGAGRVSVDGTRQTTQRLTSQTVKQNQNNIRTTIISRGQNVVTSQLYCTATYYIGRLEKGKAEHDPTFC